ncbi:ABC transporter ATP-binding protein [Bombilactobacillus thymidiniphilus]|uniref:ABC-F family ATP-binding cassette domain-containing protein n=1 Tax=Bombilactobacillus thymidiniphilus TaxID=2923363 RepID=A0ABY4PDQ5_9LACO|nr:ABC-F family ATP-binding cassette domain-containing protein [Bombilactobacillus thymidiniphilus]UQS83914.1 ABC-F family ATP-binding cassette domain-containing protein [Bombilactobacillus thymidiniphilus]
MLIVQGQDIAKDFGSDTLFSQVNFQIEEGARIGLVGANGAGKSTLLQIINQNQAASSGQISTKKQLSIGYLAQNPQFKSGNTIYEEMERIFDYLKEDERNLRNLEKQIANTTDNQADYEHALQKYDYLQNKFKADNGYGFRSEIRSVLAGFGFSEERFNEPALNLSGGEQSRLAFAKMILEQHDLLILDEPTNHLDIDTLNWLEKYLHKYPGALLIVSHDQYFLDHTVTEIYALERATLKHYHGNYTRYLQQRTKNLQLEQKAYDKQQAQIKNTEEFIQKNIARASSTKQAQSRRKQLAKLDRLAKPQDYNQQINFQFTFEQASGNDVLSVKQLTTGYDDKIMSQAISFNLKKHERLGIIGHNGVGKSTLIRTLVNKVPPLAGNISWGMNVKAGYYDQTLNRLTSNKDVLHEVWDSHPLMNETDIRNILGSFLFQNNDVFRIVRDLSGGQKARLTLCKLALEHNNLLIMDEPTNHLDLQSKEILEQALKNFAGTVLFVSHDRYLLNEVSTKILELDAKESQIYLGNYDYYLAKKAENQALNNDEKVVNPTATSNKTAGNLSYREEKMRQSEQRKKQRQLQKLEAQIEQLEQQISDLNQQMLAPENIQSYTKLQDLQTQLNQLNQLKDDLEEQWLKLSE